MSRNYYQSHKVFIPHYHKNSQIEIGDILFVRKDLYRDLHLSDAKHDESFISVSEIKDIFDEGFSATNLKIIYVLSRYNESEDKWIVSDIWHEDKIKKLIILL